MPKIPQPFQTPSINLTTTHGKEWQDVLPEELEVGDHIMNYGILAEILEDGSFIFAGQIEPIHFRPEFPISAFTKVK